MTDGTPGLAPPDAIETDDSATHRDDWTEEVPSADRIISVALTIEQPRTADWVAGQAKVSPTTARTHLERLVDLHVLSAVEQGGAKTYYPDAAYQRFREVSQLIQEHTKGEIEQIAISAKEDIEDLQQEYDAESPDELRKLAVAGETSSAEARECFRKASEWDGHIHMVSIAEKALERYREYNDQHQTQAGSVA